MGIIQLGEKDLKGIRAIGLRGVCHPVSHFDSHCGRDVVHEIVELFEKVFVFREGVAQSDDAPESDGVVA